MSESGFRRAPCPDSVGVASSGRLRSLADNKLYYGDDLDLLREHIASDSVAQVYLDPPFNSATTTCCSAGTKLMTWLLMRLRYKHSAIYGCRPAKVV